MVWFVVCGWYRNKEEEEYEQDCCRTVLFVHPRTGRDDVLVRYECWDGFTEPLLRSLHREIEAIGSTWFTKPPQAWSEQCRCFCSSKTLRFYRAVLAVPCSLVGAYGEKALHIVWLIFSFSESVIYWLRGTHISIFMHGVRGWGSRLRSSDFLNEFKSLIYFYTKIKMKK